MVIHVNSFIFYLDESTLNENKTKIETIFEFFEGDVIIRVESIKMELDNLQTDLISTIRSIKDKFLKEFLNEFEYKKLNSEKLIGKMQKVITKNEVSNECLKENMYKCQEYLNDLRRFDGSLNQKLNEISFKCSNWLPITANIGSINGHSSLFTISKTVTPNIVDLSCCIKQIFGLCNLNDEFLFITSPDENKVYILDEKYHCLKGCASVGGRYFSKPSGLCTDNYATIYLCDYGNNRVIILDEKLEEIRKVIGKHGKNSCEFDGPIDIAFSNEQLYVLEDKNFRIQILTKRGEFLSEISLLMNESVIEKPTRLSVLSESLVILDQFKSLILINFDGQPLQTIQTDQIKSFFIDENYLFTLTDFGVISLYEKASYNDTNGYFLESQREIKNFDFDVSFTSFFNGHLICSLGDFGSLAIF